MSDTDEGRRPTDGTQRARRGAARGCGGSGRAGPPARGGPPAGRGGGEPPAQAGRRAEAGPRPRGAAARDQGPAGPGGLAEREAELHAARGARAHRRPARRGRQAHPAAVGLRRGGRQERRRHRRRALQRPQDAGRPAPRHRASTSSTAAPRSCSTRASTSSWPARPERSGEVVTLKEVIDDGVRALVVGRADEERVCELADALRGMRLRPGDTLLMDSRTGLLLEKLPRPEVEDLLLEEVPDISYSDIGGLDTQIEQIADAVELPFLHQELFAEHRLPAPKGILLYGPPGLRQDAHRQGGGQLPGQEGRRQDRRRARAAATSSTSRAPSCSTSTSARPSARSAWCSSGPGRRARRAGRSSSSSTRWTRCSAPAARASAPTWSRRSCRSCWPRSTASRACATSS